MKITALVLLLISGLSACGAAFARSTQQGWYIEQRSKISGFHQMYITATAVKNLNSSGVGFITHAPDWKITILNERAKTFFDTTIDALNGSPGVALYAMYRVDLEHGNWNKGIDAVVSISGKSVRTRRYDMTKTTAVQPQATTKFDLPYLRGVSRAAYWELPDSALPRQMSALLRRIYVYPKMNGIPISVVWLNLSNDRKIALDTTLLERRNIPSETFTVPKGYKRAAKELQVYGDPASNEATEGFAGWLGESDNKNKPAKDGGK